MYKCKYCGKEFDNARILGGHISRCSKNPNYHLYIQKRKQNAQDKKERENPIKEYKLKCAVCGKEYYLNIREKDFINGRFRVTCSLECAHKLSMINSDDFRKKKISDKLKSRAKSFPKKPKIYKCVYCGKEFEKRHKNINLYCSDECMIKGRHDKLSAAAHRNKLGGLNINSTHKNYKRGYYKGIWCDSSWELAFVFYHIDKNIHIERNYEYKEYIYDNKLYKFYPDFKVNNKLIEIKGFLTPKNEAKIKQIDDVIFLFKDDMKKYLDYVIEKHGYNFWEILYE